MDLSAVPMWLQYTAAIGLAFQGATTLVMSIFVAPLWKDLFMPPTSEQELQERRLFFEHLLGGFPGFGEVKAKPTK